MQQCNYLLKFIVINDDKEPEIIERWCYVSDGTKYLTGETPNAYTDNSISLGDSRISMVIAKDQHTTMFTRENRFIIDDPDFIGSKHALAYRLTKPFKLGGVFNGRGVMGFVLSEVNTEDDDNLELLVADYYKYFPKDDTGTDPGTTPTPPPDDDEDYDGERRKVDMSIGRETNGLEEFFDYKNQFMDDILTNDLIIQLLNDDFTDISGLTEDERTELIESLLYSQVFPYEYVPDTIEHGMTFICCEVDIKEVINSTYLIPALYVWVFTHKSKVRLPNKQGVRTDKLTSEITKIINGSRFYGLGELKLGSAKRFSPVPDYQGRILTFYTKDFNLLSPTGKHAPSNRKRGV
jgi:hypothetical protein